ncbi:MAG: FAD-dependent oxidoreductase [Deltaproteobacteria bacterium]|nr:FAD-dependent oxidoreductase [Deltaproteobacteria bacterium]
MVQKTETLIIGGGAIGICCAFYLDALGKNVLLVEKNDICSGSSYGNAGLIVPSYSIPLAAPGVISQGLKWTFNPQSPFYIKPRLDRKLLAWLWKFRGACNKHHVRQSTPVLHELHSASLKLFGELANIEGMDFALEKKGLLELFITQEGFDKGIEDIRLITEFGIENRILKKKELNEFIEGIRTAAVGGAYLPHDAHLIPERFVHQLARHIEKRGVRLLTSCEVFDFEASDRHVTGIKTTRGDIMAEEIVLAGGFRSTQLAQNLQLNLSMQPAKGYSITFKRPAVCPSLPVAMAEAKVVLTPMEDTLRFAGTLELAGFDQSINLRRVQAIFKAVRAYFPDIDPNALELLEIWRGLRPCSPDGLPYLGRAPRYDNVIIATGHGMLGISLAPITGKIVSQLTSDQKPSLNIAALNVERFTRRRADSF